jgi:hypothetical protein
MSQFSSPLKLAPTSAKRGKTSLDWQECVICQTKSPEKLFIFTDKGKLSFVQATEVRKDEVYRRIVEELSSVNHILSENIEVKYHRSCCNHTQVSKILLVILTKQFQNKKIQIVLV